MSGACPGGPDGAGPKRPLGPPRPAASLAAMAARPGLFPALRALGCGQLDATLGLGEVQAPVLLIGLGYLALAEYNLRRTKEDGDPSSVLARKGRIPGNLGFDPLGVGSGQGSNTVALHNSEATAGRLAMLGVTTSLFKEFAVKGAAVAPHDPRRSVSRSVRVHDEF